MRSLFLFVMLLCQARPASSQTNVWGLYHEVIEGYNDIDLRPDSTYVKEGRASCMLNGPYRDTGIVRIIGDSLYLIPDRKDRKTEKYLVVRRPLSAPADILWRPIGSLAHISVHDCILPSNFGDRLNDYECLFIGTYIRRKGYYDDGRLMFDNTETPNQKITTYYYPTGKIKSIERYSQSLKSGDWYYYDEDSQMTKIETYSKSKLVKTVKVAR